MQDATRDQLSVMAGELPRFLLIGGREKGHSRRWVSRLFLVSKPGTNKSRLIIDLRHLNRKCKKHKLIYETLKHLKTLTPQGRLDVGRASGSIIMFVRKSKGDQRTGMTAKPLPQLPIEYHLELADLLEYYTRSRSECNREFFHTGTQE
eukprot:jgi/Tetstr1/444821/TSEL_032663.t1